MRTTLDDVLAVAPLVQCVNNRHGGGCGVTQCTAGNEGPAGVLSSESIFAHFQGLLTSVQLAATR